MSYLKILEMLGIDPKVLLVRSLSRPVRRLKAKPRAPKYRPGRLPDHVLASQVAEARERVAQLRKERRRAR